MSPTREAVYADTLKMVDEIRGHDELSSRSNELLAAWRKVLFQTPLKVSPGLLKVISELARDKILTENIIRATARMESRLQEQRAYIADQSIVNSGTKKNGSFATATLRETRNKVLRMIFLHEKKIPFDREAQTTYDNMRHAFYHRHQPQARTPTEKMYEQIVAESEIAKAFENVRTERAKRRPVSSYTLRNEDKVTQSIIDRVLHGKANIPLLKDISDILRGRDQNINTIFRERILAEIKKDPTLHDRLKIAIARTHAQGLKKTRQRNTTKRKPRA